MTDTHCHLTDPRLGDQLDAVIARARAAGVSRLVTIGTSVDDSRACIDVCDGRPEIRCAVGVHPNYVADEDLARVPELRDLQKSDAVVAIGEIGLDYHYGLQHKSLQADFFTAQLQIASECQRSVVVHCREAVDDALAILAQFPTVRCVFHCFTGSVAEARRILDRGYLLGFTGPITFKKSDDLREVVRQTPMDRLLVETDAPWLTPEPLRKQKTNEPALVTHVARTVAAVKGLSLEEVDVRTTENANRFYRWI